MIYNAFAGRTQGTQVIVTIEQQLKVSLHNIAEGLDVSRLQHALHGAYCGDRLVACAVTHSGPQHRRNLQPLPNVPRAVRQEAFDVTRDLEDGDGLAAPVVNHTELAETLGEAMTLTSTLVGNTAKVEVFSPAEDDSHSALFATAQTLPALISNRLGIERSAVSFSSAPKLLMPPALPPSPELPLDALLREEGGANFAALSRGNEGAAGGELVYLCLPLGAAIFFTIILVYAAHRTTLIVSPSLMRYMTIISGMLSFCYSAAFAISVWNQRTELIETEVASKLLVTAILSAGFVLISVMISLLILSSLMRSRPALLDMSSFKKHASQHQLIAGLALVSFETVQMLPWLDLTDSGISQTYVRTRFAIQPLMSELPQAAIISYYASFCATHDAFGQYRTYRLGMALITLGFVLISITCRSLARCCTLPQGTTSKAPLTSSASPKLDSYSSSDVDIEIKSADEITLCSSSFDPLPPSIEGLEPPDMELPSQYDGSSEQDEISSSTPNSKNPQAALGRAREAKANSTKRALKRRQNSLSRKNSTKLDGHDEQHATPERHILERRGQRVALRKKPQKSPKATPVDGVGQDPLARLTDEGCERSLEVLASASRLSGSGGASRSSSRAASRSNSRPSSRGPSQPGSKANSRSESPQEAPSPATPSTSYWYQKALGLALPQQEPLDIDAVGNQVRLSPEEPSPRPQPSPKTPAAHSPDTPQDELILPSTIDAVADKSPTADRSCGPVRRELWSGASGAKSSEIDRPVSDSGASPLGSSVGEERSAEQQVNERPGQSLSHAAQWLATRVAFDEADGEPDPKQDE